MAQMAAELGLSRFAVSSVVNGKPQQARLTESTVRRVREHLDRRGYVPSRAACDLRSSPTRVVGLLHLGTLNRHLAEAFHLLAESLSGSASGLEIMVTPGEQLEPALREMMARRVTDLVWLHNPSTGERYLEERVANYFKRTRTILYNYPFNMWPGEKELLERGVALVGVDRKLQFQRIARFLKGLGHKVVALPNVLPSVQPCMDAFTSAGLVVADCPLPFKAATLIQAMKHQGVTAAWVNGDNVACQVVDELRERGVRIPEDLTVVGFDGMSRVHRQDLTTRVMPVQEMVAKVCEIVAGMEPELRHCFDMELVKGQTHGPPRGS